MQTCRVVAGAVLAALFVACGGSGSMMVPAPPIGVTAKPGVTQVTISWNPVPDATSYNIYWSTTRGVTPVNGIKIAKVTNPYVQTGLIDTTIYYYVVTALNSGGESAASLEVSAMPGPPSAPTGVAATAGYTQATVSWDPVNPVSGVNSYNIYWSTAPSVTAANGAKIAGAPNPYVQTGLVNGTTYYYVVTAVNTLGESPASQEASATPYVVTAIAAGAAHTCAIVNGGVQCWGYNSDGQLGNSTDDSSLVPQQVTGLTSGATAIAAGTAHTCAIVNGGVQCWGYNSDGQLGNDSTANGSAPVQVYGLTSGVTAIAAGLAHTCAIVSGGVQCWGDNSHGQLGANTTTECGPYVLGAAAIPCSLVPVQVTGLPSGSGVTAIAAGGYFTCAIVNNSAQCWGDNTFGEVGANTATTCDIGDNGYPCSFVPVQVTGLTSGVTGIAAGGGFTCAIVNGGALCWGANSYGELGNPNGYGSAPAQVTGLTNGGGVTAIATGGAFTCAIVNGGVQCWGDNSYGQLGG